MNRLLYWLFAFSTNIQVWAHTITIHFPELAVQKISFTGFEWINTCSIAKVDSNISGRFAQSYSKKDHGNKLVDIKAILSAKQLYL